MQEAEHNNELPIGDFDAFVHREHRRLSTCLAIALDSVDLGVRAADHALGRLAADFDSHATAGEAVCAAFDRGLGWARSRSRLLAQRLPGVEEDLADPLTGRLVDAAAESAYRRATPDQREAAVRFALLGQPVDAEPRLTSAVVALSDELDPPLTSVEAIVDLRASERGRRRLAVVAALVLIIGIGALSAVGLAALGEDRIVTEVARPVAGTGQTADAPNLRLVWDTKRSPIGFASGWAADGATLYVLSTAPATSVQSFQPALWRTDDGETWSEQVLDLSFNAGFTVFDGRLYVLSTGPDSTSDDPEFELRVDGIDGSEVHSLVLEQLAPAFDVDAARVDSFSQHSVGAGPGGVVVSTVHDGFIDFFRLMPAEFQNGSFWPEPRADGLHIFDESAGRTMGDCVARRMDAAMAELAALEQAAAESGEWREFEQAMAAAEEESVRECEESGGDVGPVAVISWTDLGLPGFDDHFEGETLRSATTLHIDDPLAAEPAITDLSDQVPAGAHLQQIRPVGDGFVAVALSPRGGFLAGYSADGTTWVFDESGATGWPIGSGAVDGVPMAMFADESGVSVVAFVDGQWSSLGGDGPDAGGQFAIGGGVGELGLVAVYELFSEGDHEVFVEDAPAVDGGPIDGLVPGFPGSSEPGAPTQQFVVRYSADGRTWVPVMTTDPIACCAHPGVVAVGSDRITITIGSSNVRRASQVLLAAPG